MPCHRPRLVPPPTDFPLLHIYRSRTEKDLRLALLVTVSFEFQRSGSYCGALQVATVVLTVLICGTRLSLLLLLWIYGLYPPDVYPIALHT